LIPLGGYNWRTLWRTLEETQENDPGGQHAPIKSVADKTFFMKN
jgi:hypothetical protein